MFLIANGKVITRDGDGTGYFPDGGVVTDGGKIVEVGTTDALKSKYPQAEFVDAKGGVIMPGLINCHTHIYSALARGLAIKGNNPSNFYEVLDGTWWAIDRHLDLEATDASARALVLDCIKQGVTTIFDHHASFCQIPGSLMKIAEVTKEYGMRGPATIVEGIADAAAFANAVIGETRAVKIPADAIASRADTLAKKGILKESAKCEGERCLTCNVVCENCADVCPNRANVVIEMPDGRHGSHKLRISIVR